MTPRLPQSFLKLPLAHRALHDIAHGRPENSRAAVLAAVRHGFGIEVDVQLSADGVAMVFHDYGLERLTHATGPVRQKTAQDLSGIALRGADEGVPTLAEILALVDGAVPVLIEIKDQDGGMGPRIGPLEDATARAVQVYGGPVAVMSFNPHSVARLSELLPDVPRGLTTSAYDPSSWPLSTETCARLRDIPDYTRSGSSFISHEVEDLGRDRVAALKAQGADVLCWTVRSPQVEAEARQVAQNITFEGYLPALPG